MKRILIIEDDPSMASIYRERFLAEGFEVEVAADGETAILGLKASPPDVFILDLMLPRVNGVEVLKAIRSHEATQALPVVVMSHACAGGLVQAAGKAGANKCLIKSTCGPKLLVEEVRKLLAPTSAAPPAPMTGPGASVALQPTCDGSARSPSPEKGGDQPASDLRRDLLSKLPRHLVELRNLLQSLGKTSDTAPLTHLLELHRSVHKLANSASLAGLTHITQISCALETLLKDLHSRPQKLNSSSLRMIAQAVDLLIPLSRCPDTPPNEGLRAPLILVVDDEPISRETTCSDTPKRGCSEIGFQSLAQVLDFQSGPVVACPNLKNRAPAPVAPVAVAPADAGSLADATAHAPATGPRHPPANTSSTSAGGC